MTEDLFSRASPFDAPRGPEPTLRMPPEPIVRTADVEGPYRWTMSRAWGAGRTILWVLFNPSDADGKRDDPSTQRMMGFSHRWGYGSMIVANVYPFVASLPKELHAWRRTFDHRTYEGNGMRPWDLDKSSWSAFHRNQVVVSKILEDAAEAKLELTCVAAWGLGPNDADLDHFLRGIGTPRGRDCDAMGTIHPTWWCLGKTLSGAPIHPLARGHSRVPDDAVLKIWKRRSPEGVWRSGCT